MFSNPSTTITVQEDNEEGKKSQWKVPGPIDVNIVRE